MIFQIPNWSSYQSYKDRKPTWLRLHVKLIDNYEFSQLSDSAQALLPLLWIMASEYKNPRSGIIEASVEKISFRLRKKKTELSLTLEELKKSGFINELQFCNDSVTPETETETETETESTSIVKKMNFSKNRRNGYGKKTGTEEGNRLAKEYRSQIDPMDA